MNRAGWVALLLLTPSISFGQYMTPTPSPSPTPTVTPPPTFELTIPSAAVPATGVSITTGCSQVLGDVNGDGLVNILDAFYLINFVFATGPHPVRRTCAVTNHVEIDFNDVIPPYRLWICSQPGVCRAVNVLSTTTPVSPAPPKAKKSKRHRKVSHTKGKVQ